MDRRDPKFPGWIDLAEVLAPDERVEGAAPAGEGISAGYAFVAGLLTGAGAFAAVEIFTGQRYLTRDIGTALTMSLGFGALFCFLTVLDRLTSLESQWVVLTTSRFLVFAKHGPGRRGRVERGPAFPRSELHIERARSGLISHRIDLVPEHPPSWDPAALGLTEGEAADVNRIAVQQGAPTYTFRFGRRGRHLYRMLCDSLTPVVR